MLCCVSVFSLKGSKIKDHCCLKIQQVKILILDSEDSDHHSFKIAIVYVSECCGNRSLYERLPIG